MTYQFRIQLENIKKPPVWRRVTVPSTFNFEQFHQVIQSAFGWFDYHLYLFSPEGYGSYPMITNDEESDDDQSIMSDKIKLSKIFKNEGDKYVYIYDFGDDWKHKIVLEKILAEKTKTADCLDGKGACPPEDCGGPWGYENLLLILADKKHEEYAEMAEWVGLCEGEEWDVNEFDLEFAQEMVREVE
ncbi:MAG: plasmid pRiA4b ORF-3 family protein [Bacteroidales bacterium]